MDEDVKHGFVEIRIDRVSMRFPTPIRKIEFDRAPDRIVVVKANYGVTKIRASPTIPSSELNDFYLIA